MQRYDRKPRERIDPDQGERAEKHATEQKHMKCQRQQERIEERPEQARPASQDCPGEGGRHVSHHAKAPTLPACTLGLHPRPGRRHI
jgi:hypothetical protein